MWQQMRNINMISNEGDTSEKEGCWFSLLSQQKGGFTIFPLFHKVSKVIEIQGQRSRQLRMRECMHSFNACHIKDTSEQFKKGLKKEKLKPYPQPSRSEILANQERRRNRRGKRGNMGRWLDCGVSTCVYRHYNLLRHLATESGLQISSFTFVFFFYFYPVITNWDWFVFYYQEVFWT